jgi:hypothetical protein
MRDDVMFWSTHDTWHGWLRVIVAFLRGGDVEDVLAFELPQDPGIEFWSATPPGYSLA